MRRKILMGVLALALPMATVAATQTIASAKTVVPPDPARNCSVAGTVHFQPPGLSKAGSYSMTLKKSTTTATASFGAGCTGTTGSLAIVSKDTKCKGPGKNVSPCKSTAVKNSYSYDTESSFASTGTTAILKSLKKLNFTLDGVAYQVKTTGASEVACSDNVSPPGGSPTETGFKITGVVKKPKQDKNANATLTACLGHDTGPGTSGNFTLDLLGGTGTIATAAIDGVTSKVTISKA